MFKINLNFKITSDTKFKASRRENSYSARGPHLNSILIESFCSSIVLSRYFCATKSYITNFNSILILYLIYLNNFLIFFSFYLIY